MAEKLTLRKSEWLDDWYVIERAEHDGKTWLEPVGRNTHSLQSSARISDADVEGTAEEMLDIAEAIEKRGASDARRCAVRVHGDKAYFWSPRNSQFPGVVSLATADALATEIRATLTPASPAVVHKEK